MHCLVAVLILTITWFSVATFRLQFSCDHHLQQNVNYSKFFEHCKCRYSDWTEWVIPENAISVAVPSQKCPSEMAWPEERWQKVISGYECENKREERHICKLCNNHGMHRLGTRNTFTNFPVFVMACIILS